jgi:tight adherence protein C
VIVVPVLCGLGIGLALWLGARALAPSPPTLAGALADLERPRPLRNPQERAATRAAVSAGIGARVAAMAAAAGVDVGPRLRADLELAGRSYERYLIEKVAAAGYGLVLPAAVYVVLAVVGVQVPVGVVLVGVGLLMVGGFFVPGLVLRAQVQERRRDFDHAFALYLELVSLVLAGGGGIETSLLEAAETGDGWAFQQIRAALGAARLTGRTPWEAFGELGERLRISTLEELAASVSLAGEQGAKVRASLTAKAASLREHEVREAEADAESASERMTIPLVMLLFGFVVFIGYPAVIRVLSSL